MVTSLAQLRDVTLSGGDFPGHVLTNLDGPGQLTLLRVCR
jgi:hypothetical protein